MVRGLDMRCAEAEDGGKAAADGHADCVQMVFHGWRALGEQAGPLGVALRLARPPPMHYLVHPDNSGSLALLRAASAPC